MEKPISNYMDTNYMESALRYRGHMLAYCSIRDVIEVLLHEKECGNPLSFRFNGFKIEPDDLSPENIERIVAEYEEYAKDGVVRPIEISYLEMRSEADGPNVTINDVARVIMEYKNAGIAAQYIFNGMEIYTGDINSEEEVLARYEAFMRSIPDKEDSKIDFENAVRAALGVFTKEELATMLDQIASSERSADKEEGEQSHDEQ